MIIRTEFEYNEEINLQGMFPNHHLWTFESHLASNMDDVQMIQFWKRSPKHCVL